MSIASSHRSLRARARIRRRSAERQPERLSLPETRLLHVDSTAPPWSHHAASPPLLPPTARRSVATNAALAGSRCSSPSDRATPTALRPPPAARWGRPSCARTQTPLRTRDDSSPEARDGTIRKELCRRYPKHSLARRPEDGCAAAGGAKPVVETGARTCLPARSASAPIHSVPRGCVRGAQRRYTAGKDPGKASPLEWQVTGYSRRSSAACASASEHSSPLSP